MAERFYAQLPARGLLEVAGEDRVAFLQGLVTNDVTKVRGDRTIFAALLTAQGRYLFDFFIFALGDALYLETEAARIGDLKRRLGIYKLRSKIGLTDVTARFAIAAGFGPQAAEALGLATEGAAKTFAGGIAYADPRLAELGVPDGIRDLPIEKALLLESGFDELNGIDWQKGCYMGQELTARTKYRALIKKRLLPVTIEGPLPAPGTPIMRGSEEAGEIHSGRDGRALALLRLDALDATKDGTPLVAGVTRVKPEKPSWAKF